MNQTLAELKEEIDPFTVVDGDFNTPFSAIVVTRPTRCIGNTPANNSRTHILLKSK